jgi:ribosomal protein L32
MAVQQNKKSPSKRGMHRSHNALNVPGIAVKPTCVTTSAPPVFTVGVKCSRPSLKPDSASHTKARCYRQVASGLCHDAVPFCF